MTIAIPIEQVQDAQSMSADAEIDLYELTPAGGGTLFCFKNDNEVEWQGNTYYGLPLQFSGESFNSEGSNSQPQLTIGQPDIDLSAFKGLVYDDALDGAEIKKHTVLLAHVIGNQNIKRTRIYRVKRVVDYSASQIVLALAAFSPAGATKLPHRQYIPPAFPFVRI